MKNNILALTLLLLQAFSVSLQSPIGLTDAPTQPGALTACNSWYVASPGDGCDTILNKFSANMDDPSDLWKWNPPIKDCWHDVWAGYRYCVSMPQTLAPSYETSVALPSADPPITAPIAGNPDGTVAATMATITICSATRSGKSVYYPVTTVPAAAGVEPTPCPPLVVITTIAPLPTLSVWLTSVVVCHGTVCSGQ